jgi:hypothetical protein
MIDIIAELKKIDSVLFEGDKDKAHLLILKLIRRLNERTISSRDKVQDKKFKDR